MRLEDLPPRFREQAERQLRGLPRQVPALRKAPVQSSVEEPTPDDDSVISEKAHAPGEIQQPNVKVKNGARYGKLVVIESGKSENKKRVSICKCDCGSILTVWSASLIDGSVSDCGCDSENELTNAKDKGGKWNPLYKCFEAMRARCLRPSDHNYHNYGARGIKVCKEWMEGGYKVFRLWAIRNGYHQGLSLDRIDNDGDYSPENCRWADNVTQGRNRRTNISLTYKGTTLTLAEWAERTGLYYTTLLERFRKGWTPEEIIETPKRVYTRGEKAHRKAYIKFSLFVNPMMLSTGQQKRMNFKTGTVFTNPRVANGMRLVEIAAKPHKDEIHRVCPPNSYVAVTVVFLCLYPKGTKESERIERAPMGKTFDCDNKFKSVGDAFTNAGWWADDRHVTTLHIEKRYTKAQPRIEVIIEPDVCRPLALVNDEDDTADSPIETAIQNEDEKQDGELFQSELFSEQNTQTEKEPLKSDAPRTTAAAFQSEHSRSSADGMRTV